MERTIEELNGDTFGEGDKVVAKKINIDARFKMTKEKKQVISHLIPRMNAQ